MNNLALISVLLASSGIVFLVERTSVHNLRMEGQRLAGEIASIRRLTAEAAVAVASLKNKLEEQRNQRTARHSRMSIEDAGAATIPMGSQNESVWPPDKPYFYLNKKNLTNAFFQRFARDYHLSPEAVIVLGMTPSEATTADDAFHDVIEKFRALEAENLTPSTEHAGTRFPMGKKTSYRLPALEDQMRPIVENFLASTGALLGDSRAEIFSHWTKLCFADSFGDFAPKARIFTLTDEELKGDRKLTRLEVVEEGGKQLHYFELWDPPRDYGLPEDVQPRFFYRHLFGDNGQKRPGIQPLSE
jgi:hypothetical protein